MKKIYAIQDKISNLYYNRRKRGLDDLKASTAFYSTINEAKKGIERAKFHTRIDCYREYTGNKNIASYNIPRDFKPIFELQIVEIFVGVGNAI